MKKIKELLLCLAIVSIATSCYKSSNELCDYGIGGGISSPTSITLYLSKDKGWGPLTLHELTLHRDNGEKYSGNGRGEIDRYFSEEPTCRTEGTIYFDIAPGQKAEYKLISDNGTIYSGWVQAGCEEGCYFQDISK